MRMPTRFSATAVAPGSSALLAAGLAVGLVASLVGCEEDVINRIAEPEILIDELSQKKAAEVDILWVVDNSPTMVDEQAKLAENFTSFIKSLTECQGGMGADDLCDFATSKCTLSGKQCTPPDYHIGVISTDVYAAFDQGRLRKVGLCVPSRGATPASGKFRYCQGEDRHCAADANDPASDPANTTCDMTNPIGFITPSTPGAQNAFARAVRVGTGGSGNENGIRAAAMAIGRDSDRGSSQFKPVPTENAGFLRPTASLFVIFVSDETDYSFGKTSYFYRVFEGAKGAGNEGMVSVSAIVGDLDPDGTTGSQTGGCPTGMLTAAPGTAYVALAMYTRGLADEFRVCDEQRLTCGTGQRCVRPEAMAQQGLPGVCAPAACTSAAQCGSATCGQGQPCFTCDQGACNLSGESFLGVLVDNGIYGSLCAERYADVLDPLGFSAAGLRRKFEITKFPDCSKIVPCTEGTEVPICVRVDGQIIPQGPTGWVYEAGSNAIFFDGEFVPPPQAVVSVSYRAAPGDQAISCASQQQ